MRIRVVSTVLIVLACSGPAWDQAPAQTPSAAQTDKKPEAASAGAAAHVRWLRTHYTKPEVPKTLEELLAKALKDNPDIRLAETKVREAEAQLNKTRLDVMQKAIKVYHDLDAYRALLKEAQSGVEQKTKLWKEGALPQATLHAAQLSLQQAKSNLAKIEADVPFLMGSHAAVASVAFSPDGGTLAVQDPAGRVVLWDALTGMRLQYAVSSLAVVARQPQAEKIREALNTPVQGEFDAVKLLKLVQEKLKGMNLHTGSLWPSAGPGIGLPENLITQRKLHLTEAVPLGAALQWIEDSFNYRFVVRDYGIVLVPGQRLPPGAVLLFDLWKNPAEKGGTSRGK